MNLRPPGYEPDELPSCSTPRHSVAFIGDIDYYTLFQQFCQEGAESFFAAEAEGENAAADLLSRKPAATPIHAPPRGATGRHVAAGWVGSFQFTPLREGRRKSLCYGCTARHFNSRPSARGDQSKKQQRKSATFQFTPLREGRQGRTQKSGAGHISIHAPPRGATGPFPVKVSTLSFQFTPLREGRRLQCRTAGGHTHFNSRPSARGDTAWRLTWSSGSDFNSRPSARGDIPERSMLHVRHVFQFTPLREGRQHGSKRHQ